jgi:hypothetical protein
VAAEGIDPAQIGVLGCLLEKQAVQRLGKERLGEPGE